MLNLTRKGLRYLGCVIVCLAYAPLSAQVMHFGAKGGAQLSWVSNDDKSFREDVKVVPQPGYSAGFVLAFKVKERFFLHSEYLFSTKGKLNTGRRDPSLRDDIVYHYFDVPVLYNIQFRGSLGNGRQFKWYLGAGPLFSYWLGGKGTVTNNEFIENDFPPLEYRIRFRPSDDGPADVVMSGVNRLQLGVNIGGGAMFEPTNGRKIMVDLRIEIGHSWLGTPTSARYVIPVTYSDNLKARNMGLRLSTMYLFEQNTDKKVRNKGKSNVVQKGKMIKRKK